MNASTTSPRYTGVAVTLHWILAVLILVQIYVGWTFGDMERGPARMEWFMWHKTLGFAILALSLARLGWRLTHKPPAYPETMPGWQKLAASIVHWGFYLIMIGLPLTGWAASSTGRTALETGIIPILGGLNVPALPGLSAEAHEPSEIAHNALVKVTYALFLLHIAAVAKHLLEKSDVPGRMIPFLAKKG